MSHRTACYDGERLECVCGLRGDAETREAEQISRAEAQELVDIYSLTATAAVLNAIFPPDKR
jgi:hypothetical protein